MTTTTQAPTCPACGDEYDDNASQCRAVWSDLHDDIVCVTCKEQLERGN